MTPQLPGSSEDPTPVDETMPRRLFAGRHQGRCHRAARVVTRVAATVLPSVASLAVRTPRGGGAGGAVVLTSDGFLLTSTHVVAGGFSGRAAFADGTRTTFDVVGADPLSDLAVLRIAQVVPGSPAVAGLRPG